MLIRESRLQTILRINLDGTNVYAHTREECEEKLKVLIVEMKAEIAEIKAGEKATNKG